VWHVNFVSLADHNAGKSSFKFHIEGVPSKARKDLDTRLQLPAFDFIASQDSSGTGVSNSCRRYALEPNVLPDASAGGVKDAFWLD
jgi:hypothetical protein